MNISFKPIPFLIACILTHSVALAQDELKSDKNKEGEHEEVSNKPFFRLGSQRTWLFRSFLNDPGDDANTLGIEFENYINVGKYNVKNISYFEVNQYPRVIPGQPNGNPTSTVQTVAADGINDLLMGFWFAERGKAHSKHHFTVGFATQLPTATDKTLGSGKFSIGPSFDYEYENGRWFAGAIALQVWSIAGPSDRKDVNLLMIKPFIVYNVVKRFDLVYMPYGISVYWNKPSGEAVYLPLGGGGQYQIPLGAETTLNMGAQLFNNVIRPTKGTEYDLRFLIEFVF